MEIKRHCASCGSEEGFQEGTLTRGSSDINGLPVYFDSYFEGEKEVSGIECKKCGYLMLFTK